MDTNEWPEGTRPNDSVCRALYPDGDDGYEPNDDEQEWYNGFQLIDPETAILEDLVHCNKRCAERNLEQKFKLKQKEYLLEQSERRKKSTGKVKGKKPNNLRQRPSLKRVMSNGKKAVGRLFAPLRSCRRVSADDVVTGPSALCSSLSDVEGENNGAYGSSGHGKRREAEQADTYFAKNNSRSSLDRQHTRNKVCEKKSLKKRSSVVRKYSFDDRHLVDFPSSPHARSSVCESEGEGSDDELSVEAAAAAASDASVSADAGVSARGSGSDLESVSIHNSALCKDDPGCLFLQHATMKRVMLDLKYADYPVRRSRCWNEPGIRDCDLNESEMREAANFFLQGIL